MLNPQAIKTISDLRENPLKVIQTAKRLAEPVYVFHRSKPMGVMLDVEQYEELINIIQDYQDAWEIKRQREDPAMEWTPFEEVKKSLKKNE